MATVDELLKDQLLWQHWRAIADFTIDSVRIGDRPPTPLRTPGLKIASVYENRLDQKYREAILVAHTLSRMGYQAAALTFGDPDRHQPDLHAAVADGEVWIEHTDLCDELFARAQNTSLSIEVKVQQAIANDRELRDALVNYHLTLSLASPPSTSGGVESRVVTEIIDFIRARGFVSATPERFTVGVCDERRFPELLRHGAQFYVSMLPGTALFDIMQGTGLTAIPWPRGPFARKLIAKKQAKTYRVTEPMWLLMTSTNFDGFGDPTLAKLAMDIAPFERFIFFADWHSGLVVNRKAVSL